MTKHVPHGREERKTARDGTPGPKKERAVPIAGKIVIELFEQWRRKNLRIENPMRVNKLEKLVLPSW